MTWWKVATSAIGVLGISTIFVVVALGALGPEWDPLGSRKASGGPTTPSEGYSGVSEDNVVVAAGEVDVDGGTVALAPTVPGAVVEVAVKEGRDVKEGELLLKLDSRMAELRVKQAEAALARAGVELNQAREAVEAHRHQVEQLRQGIVVANARLHAQERQVNKLEKLNSEGGAPDENFLTAKDLLQELQAAVTVAKEQLAQAEHNDPALKVQLAEVGESAARTDLESARELLSKHSLVAPSDGKILRLQVGVGQVLSSADPRPLIWFCPSKRNIVRCEVEQEFADRIQPGMPVKITNESFDRRQWTGKVRQLAPWVAPRRNLANRFSELGDVPTVECVVDLDSNQRPLRIGQRVRVRVEPLAEPVTPTEDAAARN